MTYLRYIILPFLLLLSFIGCTQDEEENVVNGEIRLLLNIPGATLTKSIAAETGESTISNVYLLFYAQGAADADAPAFFHSETGLSADGTWSKSFKTTEMPGLEPHTTYDVYVLASLPAGVSAPTATTTKGTLLALEEKLTDQTTSSPSISFSGTSTYTTGVLGEQKIDLKRTVARFDITLDNQTSAQNIKVSLVEEPSSVFYLKGKTDSPLTNTNRIASTISENLYRFYLYEHTAGSRPVSIYVSGTTAVGEPISHYIQIEPDGSSQIKRNHIYNISLTLQVDDITVSVGKPVDWSEVVANTPSLSDIVMQPSSNTYIVAPSGKPIRIPVKRANEANEASILPDNSAFGTIPAIATGEQLEAELVWTDVKGAVSARGMAVDAAIADIQVIGTGPEASLLVTPGTQPGNAVVAVRKVGGDIKWSWLIWVTAYTPDDNQPILDRNLGAKTADLSLVGDNDNGVIGTYYQWGRPTPFPTKQNGAWVSVPIYDAEGNEVNISTVEAANIAALIATPLNFSKEGYAGNYSNPLWGEMNTKNVLDPCPEGWMMPAYTFWNNSIAHEYVTNATGETIGSKSLVNNAGTYIFFPTTWGMQNTQGGQINSGVKHAYNWSDSRSAQGNGLGVYYGINNIAEGFKMGVTSTAWGFPVRCIKEPQP